MAKNADGSAGEDGKKGLLGGKLKLIAIILPVLLVAIGAGVYFVAISGGKSSETKTSASASKDCEEGAEDCEDSAAAQDEETASDSEEESTPASTEKPGEVVTVDPVTINLAAGHYLKVGLAMQATADAGEHVPPGIAADALITQFSGKTVEELSSEEGREEAKKELLKSVKKLYHHKVYEIYYTTYVMN